jgi:uncharacterized protein YggU (UPF0235/DUF167 family)
VETRGREVVVRVRSAPEARRATEEARRALAGALNVAPSRVRLRSGARSRTKTFEVDGMGDDQLSMRLWAT